MSILLTRIKPARIFLIILFLLALFFFSFSYFYQPQTLSTSAIRINELDNLNSFELNIAHQYTNAHDTIPNQISDRDSTTEITLARTTQNNTGTTSNQTTPSTIDYTSHSFFCNSPGGDIPVKAPTSWSVQYYPQYKGTDCAVVIKQNPSAPNEVVIAPIWGAGIFPLHSQTSTLYPKLGGYVPFVASGLPGGSEIIQVLNANSETYVYTQLKLDCSQYAGQWGVDADYINNEVAGCDNGSIAIGSTIYTVRCTLPQGVTDYATRCGNLLKEITVSPLTIG
jgi:hypothetical protein